MQAWWMSEYVAPGLAASKPACWESSTAWYSFFWKSVNLPVVGKVRVMSAVYRLVTSTPASISSSSPEPTVPVLRIQCRIGACAPEAMMVS